MGNPGGEYSATRHNLGFVVVERLARELGVREGARAECRSLVVEASSALLSQPQTYMNRSGAAVRCLAERYELATADLLVVYDEVHLPLGRIRLRPGGGPGGHRGMESIVETLCTEGIPRLRLGVGPVPEALAQTAAEGLAAFVLAPFLAEERPAAEAMIDRAVATCRIWLESGIELAMNRVNLPDLPETAKPS